MHLKFKFPTKNSEFFRICILRLHFPSAFCICISRQKIEIFLIQIFEFPAKNLDSIAGGGAGGHGDNIGTSSFGHSALNQ